MSNQEMSRREFLRRAAALGFAAYGLSGCGGLRSAEGGSTPAEGLGASAGALTTPPWAASDRLAALNGDLRSLLGVLDPAIEGGRTLDLASGIWSTDRYFTFPKFHETAAFVTEKLRAAGLQQVSVMEMPADGKSTAGDWVLPMAWDVEEAYLDVIGPDGSKQRVADRSRIPCALGMWSCPTPPGGTEADLVYLPPRTRAGNVRGKVVFTFAHPSWGKSIVVDQGAAGMLSDSGGDVMDSPEAVDWVNAWSETSDWVYTARDKPAWAFLISPRAGEALRQRFQQGDKLRARALIRSRLYEGTVPLVTGLIRGEGSEEVLVVAHLYEQGAVDNASGGGIMLAMAAALQKLIDEGKLPTPKRSIRFLFTFECYGTLYWAEHSGRAPHTVAALCLDGIGEKPEVADIPTEVHGNPHFQMSYVDPLLLLAAGQVMSSAPDRRLAQAEFELLDNLVVDRTIDIPCPWIGGRNGTHHTSADTPEVLDAKTLGLVARMSAAYLYMIASADSKRAAEFADLTAVHAEHALASAAAAEVERMKEAGLDDSMSYLRYLTDRHVDAVASAFKLLSPSEQSRLRPHVEARQREVRRVGEREVERLARRAGKPGHEPPVPYAQTGPLASIRPRRLGFGPVSLDRLSEEEREGHPNARWTGGLFRTLNWCDGKRTLAEAAYLAASDLRSRPRRSRWGEAPAGTQSPDEMMRQIDWRGASMIEYFEFLRRRGYVTW